jgi:hypothetical protein
MPRPKKKKISKIDFSGSFYSDSTAEDMEYAVILRSPQIGGKIQSITIPDLPEDYYIITDFIQGKDVTKPRFTARQIKTGQDVKSRIKKSKIFKENPFGLYSVLRISEFDKEFKKKPINGEWVVTDETEDVLNNYEVIK